VDGVEDAPVADADAPEVLVAGEFETARWTRVISESVDGSGDA
jgi:hypothetical protein